MNQEKFRFSIIIPVLNEQQYIGPTLEYLTRNIGANTEIIVVDGGSQDQTVHIATKFGATVLNSQKGRAKQMNFGAKYTKGNILYFLHVDTLPPEYFESYILSALKNGHSAGCFRMRFDSKSYFLRFFAWFTRINHSICRGGDQSLFITKKLFQSTQGFDEKYRVYEDNEFITRLYSKTNFKILPHYVRTSARKYQEKGMIRLQYHFGIIHLKNYLGSGPDKLYDYYQRKISF